MNHIRRYFIAGLIVWLPIWATYVVIKFLVGLLDGTVALLPEKYQPAQLFGHHIPGIGLILTLIIVFVTGLLVTNFIGHWILSIWEKILSRIPLIRSIYSAVKQVLHVITEPKNQSFRRVLLVQYPRKGLWSLCFQTSGNFNGPKDFENMITVFVPTTPNPTSGFLIIVPKEDVIELEISIEDAFKMIISLGVVMPNNQNDTPQTEKI